jgi:hypothetical protein
VERFSIVRDGPPKGKLRDSEESEDEAEIRAEQSAPAEQVGEATALKEIVANLTLENRLLKKPERG